MCPVLHRWREMIVRPHCIPVAWYLLLHLRLRVLIAVGAVDAGVQGAACPWAGSPYVEVHTCAQSCTDCVT